MYKNSITDRNNISLDQICHLIKIEIVLDEIKCEVEHKIPRRVFCGELPIMSSEVANASSIGIRPEKLIVIDFEEYNNEKYLIYGNKEYTIYRTYRQDDYIELYCGERLGNENA